ncbi:MAG TPA: malto-oligosyltrehalose trehalohydrolase [Vicinamibacterales bacterium]|nr:malto-oligosyltrehalose trehalohydrolase [Vicinamibacterales bacterium]
MTDHRIAPAARRLSVGAEPQPGGGVHTRVWAPACRHVDLVVEASGGRRLVAMNREADGHFEAFDAAGGPGDRYWFQLDGDRLRPDPASRSQPDGPHGASAVVDPRAFRWTDAAWPGVARAGHAIYELHIGTFTPAGTFAAATEQLPDLAALGITLVEVMPVAEFAGEFGWGYDGVDLYAPTRLYGTPDDFRRFVDRAHGLGLGVLLDVVYNHLGPDGNYLTEFSPDYFTDRYRNDWGQAINFEGPPAAREYFVQNGGYWIDEFHVDGLRLDATQDIHDASPEHVIASIVRRARDAGGARGVLVVAENEPQETRIVRPVDAGGYGADALWNDDAHHAAVVALTGRREAYYTDYRGSAQELVSCAKYGYLFQGQYYSWQSQRRGTPGLDLAAECFVAYLQNHDQVANSASGRRLHQIASAPALRALTAWLLLGPATPMIFQGDEYAASSPFLYFADHPTLRESITSGRREFLAQFASVGDPDIQRALPPPTERATFTRCKLDPGERTRRPDVVALYRDLLQIRRTDPVLRDAGRCRVDGAVLGAGAFVLRYFDARHGDRLLIVDLADDLDALSASQPLVAPPFDRRWTLAWSSESPKYGGEGTPAERQDGQRLIPGRCAEWFTATATTESDG